MRRIVIYVHSSSDDEDDRTLLADEPEPEADVVGRSFNSVKLHVLLAACSERAL